MLYQTIPIWTGSTNCIDLAKQWLTCCQTDHKTLCNPESSGGLATTLPTRILYVGDIQSSTLRLEELSWYKDHQTKLKYLAFSFCGDKNNLHLSTKLTVDKLDQWYNYIEEKELPVAFQQAIQFTRRIGLNYLWIECLCLTHDNNEDLNLKSKEIGNAFTYAHGTIASNSTADTDIGCFSERFPHQDYACHLLFSDKRALTVRSNGRVYDNYSFLTKAEDGSLSNGPWTFQERLLSQRIVHFGTNFLFYECRTHIASELIKSGRKYIDQQEVNQYVESQSSLFQRLTGTAKLSLPPRNCSFPSAYNPINGYRAAFDTLQRNKTPVLTDKDALHLHHCWFQLVCAYTSVKFDKATDRHLAILGLIHKINRDNEVTLAYLNGLWKRHLVFDLLWYIEIGRSVRPESIQAPSWSWESVMGEVHQLFISDQSAFSNMPCSLIKVAEATLDDESCAESSSSKSYAHRQLNIHCPVFRITKITQVSNDFFTMVVHSNDDEVTGKFIPDTECFDRDCELFCAELVRERINNSSATNSIVTQWSNGIVLQRTYFSTAKGLQVIYKRVGRCWIEWPVISSNADSYIGSDAPSVRLQTIKVI
jgi:hypothetical protein